MSTVKSAATNKPPLFALGQIVATPAVLHHLEKHGINASDYLNRHVRGDWGDVPKCDAAANDFALPSSTPNFVSY